MRAGSLAGRTVLDMNISTDRVPVLVIRYFWNIQNYRSG